MTKSDLPELLSFGTRVRWSAASSDAPAEGRLEDVTSTRARLTIEDPTAQVGQEIRISIEDESGIEVAVGLMRVLAVDAAGLDLDVLSLGVAHDLVRALAEPSKGDAPPSLPGKVGGPPPLRLDRPRVAMLSDPSELAPVIEPLPVRRTGILIGIDLGTTNTCASYVKDGRAQVIPGRTGTSTIPSMITFEPDGTFHVGQRAADRQILYPLRTVYGTKRLLGRTYRSEIAADLQKHFAYPLGEAEGQRYGVRIDERVIAMDTIAARVLDEVRSSAEEHLKAPVEAAVITVPAYFTEVQREAVRRAAAQAKLSVFRIVNEPTAAAIAYGHKQEKAARIAVWDFGGGTFDFSIVDVSDGQLEVVATGGDNFVGGSDFDDIVASYLLDEFRRKENIDFEPDPQQIARLRAVAEEAKRALSVDDEHTVDVPELVQKPRRNLHVQLTREKFEELTRPLVDRTLQIANEVMSASNIEISAVDDVLLIGGTTRIPAVEKAVADLFKRRPSKRINPDEAVALGAALLADEIVGGKTMALVDILPMSVGRAVAGRRFEPIVERYARVPAHRDLTLDADILGGVYVPLFQGESPDASQNEFLCSIMVEDRSLWDGGRVTIRLSFDEHCVMAVEAFHAKTLARLPVKLDRSRPVEEVLRDLGPFEGEKPEVWKLPETGLGKVFGKVFKLFGR